MDSDDQRNPARIVDARITDDGHLEVTFADGCYGQPGGQLRLRLLDRVDPTAPVGPVTVVDGRHVLLPRTEPGLPPISAAELFDDLEKRLATDHAIDLFRRSAARDR
jgi:hypothetical protein